MKPSEARVSLSGWTDTSRDKGFFCFLKVNRFISLWATDKCEDQPDEELNIYKSHGDGKCSHETLTHPESPLSGSLIWLKWVKTRCPSICSTCCQHTATGRLARIRQFGRRWVKTQLNNPPVHSSLIFLLAKAVFGTFSCPGPWMFWARTDGQWTSGLCLQERGLHQGFPDFCDIAIRQSGVWPTASNLQEEK